MENFRFLSPTEIVFGRGTESLTGELVKRYASKILFHYGGGSIKRTGLYDRVMS
ncbi:MAG: iron-containing alcohol dehydrogenase, partial [Limnochordia bacterium]